MGGLYVLLMIGLVSGLSYLMTGGVTPEIERNPENPQVVQIEDQTNPDPQQNLQLVNIGIKPTETPTPTPSSTPTPTIPGVTASPTPTPTRVVSRTPTPTLTQTACLDKTVITLILDESTSMRADNKIGQLNTAMRSFVNKLQDDTVVGAVQFAGPASFPSGSGSNTLLPYTRFGSNPNLVRDRLTNLQINTSSANDGTYMRNAFSRAVNNINSARQTYENQGYNFVTILFTDGVPETQFYDGNCVVYYPAGTYSLLCFSRVQDPRSDMTSNLKNASDKVYAVGLYTGGRERQAIAESRRLLASTVTQSDYATDTSNPSNLTSLFDSILASACE